VKELFFYLPLALILLGLVLWLLRPRSARRPARPPLDHHLAAPLANHYRYFPQVRQALSAADEKYLRRRLPPHLAKQALRERRAVARKFLAGLHEDFLNLEHLARMVATLSPVVSREQEIERLWLGFRFRSLYAWVWLRLASGSTSLQQIERLAGLIGRLTNRMEQAMAAAGTLPEAEEFTTGFGA